MTERITFTLVVNNKLRLEDFCGNNRREIQATSESLLYELHKIKQVEKVDSHVLYYTIKSKA